MKTKFLNTIGILALAATINTASAQTMPNTFSYQAVITTEDGSPVSNHEVTVEVSIKQGNDCENNSSCPVLWQELHSPTTNEFGSFSIEIGDSKAVNTTGGELSKYSDINWLDTKKGNYYMQVRVDFGEASYLNGMTDLGTTKFSAVPYAIAAENAAFANALATDKNGKIANKIGQLADVNIDNATKNQILVFDGTSWKNTDPAGSQTLNINDLGDVTINNANKNNVLTFNYTDKIWVNRQLSFDMFNTPNAKVGQVLTYSENETWEPKDATGGSGSKLSALSDVKITELADGQTLRYSAEEKKWKNADPGSDKIWNVDPKKTFAYTTYKKVGIGTNIDKEENYAKALLHIKDGNNNTLFNARGITIGASVNRIKTTASIALGNGVENDVEGTAVLAGSGSTTGINAVNSIIMGDKANGNGNCDIVIGQGSYAGFEHCALFGNSLNAGYSNQYIFGKYNTYCGPGSNIMFIVANGTSKTELKNIFTIDKDGNVTCTGTLNGSSDSRLKTNVATMESSLDKVLKLRGVTFNWKNATSNTSNKLQYGFIAQEVEKVLPDLVGTDSNGFKTVNYTGVIPVLTEAIKTQQEEIESLKSENEQLKSTLEQLLKRVEALENK
ncbi:MAG: tail fiber domain-containing protein [Bacteroidales bacterium]|nr:tail fiber domain-containing protein [Bacteroidales bacterium]